MAKNGLTLLDIREKRFIISDGLRGVGVGEADFFAQRPPDSLHPADRDALAAQAEKLKAGAKDHVQGHFRFVDGAGKTKWLALSIHVISRDFAGAPQVLLVRDQDITELIQAREELRERLVEIDSLKELLRAINRSLDFNETIHRIIAHLHKLIPFDRATVQAVEDDQLVVTGHYGYTDPLVRGLRFPLRGIDNPSARAIASLQPVICNDVEKEFKGFVRVQGGFLVQSWLGIPLVVEGQARGLFALDSARPGFYTEQHARVAATVAEHIAIAMEHARQHTLVKEEARTDNLTGVANRRGLELRGAEILFAAHRDGKPLGVLMLDIDHFKTINDQFGHAYGDKVLVALGAHIQKNLRAQDFLARFGGDEFVILLPFASMSKALAVAERLRESIAQMPVKEGRPALRVSVGVFAATPDAGEGLYEFIRRADQALYRAKEAGRDRCLEWNQSCEPFENRHC